MYLLTRKHQIFSKGPKGLSGDRCKGVFREEGSLKRSKVTESL